MKIVTWNCNGKFREKLERITDDKFEYTYLDEVDIYVIQECEDPKKEGKEYEKYHEFAGIEGEDYFWVGDGRGDKGLGIFRNKDKKESITLKRIKVNGNYRHFIAVEVNKSFNLLAVWAMEFDKSKKRAPYVEMIHDFVDENPDLFNKKLIMCGDFNSNSVFDDEHTYVYTHRDKNGYNKHHTNLDMKLNDLYGLYSVYHNVSGEENGEETQFTFFQSRHLNEPFHLDYVYANKKIIKDTTLAKNGEKLNEDLPNKFEILDFWHWVCLSDHLPLVFEFD